MNDATLLELTAVEVAGQIRAGRVSSREVVGAALDRIGAVNDVLNAVVTVTGERAVDEAAARDEETAGGISRGPLHGVPITIKDMFDTEGVVTTGGTVGRATHTPDEDAVAVARLRAAGAIVVGKTNTPELAAGAITDNALFGLSGNPYDPSRTTGGSSGGAAAIIAVGGAFLELGSDTGGSIRQPAAYCGVTGLKPTRGRVSQTGYMMPRSVLTDFNTIGPMARSVEDVAMELALIAGPDGADLSVPPVPLEDHATVAVSGLRVAIQVDNGIQTPSTDVADVVQRAGRALADAGAHVEEMDRLDGQEEALNLFFEILAATTLYRFGPVLATSGTERPFRLLEASLARFAPVDLERCLELMEEVDAVRTRMLRAKEHVDAIVSPAVAWASAPRHEDAEGTRHSYITPYNLAGWPGLVVPGAMSAAGLPIGVQVLAGPWQEHIALAVGAVLEDALDGVGKPDLSALIRRQ